MSNKIYSFTQYDEYYISGRGQVFKVNKNDHPDVAGVQVGDQIQVRNQVWVVTGIERARKLLDITPPLYGDNYGLFVRLVE